MFRRRNKKHPVREGRWTQDEHERFLQGMKVHGRSWSKVAGVVLTRNTVQVRSHAQKYEMKMEKEEKCVAREATNSAANEHHQIDADASSTQCSLQVTAPESVASTPAPSVPSHELQTEAPVHQQIEREDMLMGTCPRTPNLDLSYAHDAWPALTAHFDDSSFEFGNSVHVVSEIMQYEPWNELPPSQGTRSPTLTMSSEDDVMLYFDVANSMDVGSSELMAWDDHSTDELDSRGMFPSFPSGGF